MNSFYQQALNHQKKILDDLVTLQSTFFQGYQKLLQLNWQALGAQCESTRQKTQTAAQAKDPREALGFTATLAQPDIEALLAYSEQAREIVSSMQSTMARVCNEHLAQQQQQLNEAVAQLSNQVADNFSNRAKPAGSSRAESKPTKKASE